MATKRVGGGVSFPSGLATRGRVPKISNTSANLGFDMEDSELYSPGPVTIPNASVLTLRATPYELLPALGAGKIAQLVHGVLQLDYTAPAFTESADNLEIRYTNASGAIISLLEMTGFITLTADGYLQVVPLKDVLMVANAAIVLFNNGDGEFGNAGGGALVWHATYAIRTAA